MLFFSFLPLMSASARGARAEWGWAGGSCRSCWPWEPGSWRCSCWSSSSARSPRAPSIRRASPARRRTGTSRTSWCHLEQSHSEPWGAENGLLNPPEPAWAPSTEQQPRVWLLLTGKRVRTSTRQRTNSSHLVTLIYLRGNWCSLNTSGCAQVQGLISFSSILISS